MYAKIYQPARSAMQSGMKNTAHWVVEFTGPDRQVIDPLTGTHTSTNTLKQLDLKFKTMEDAVAYAKARGIPYHVTQKPARKRISRSYAENFDTNRKLPWTH